MKRILAVYSFVFLLALWFVGLGHIKSGSDLLLVLVLLPVIAHFFLRKKHQRLKSFLIIYSAIVLFFIATVALFSVRNFRNFLSVIPWLPAVFYLCQKAYNLFSEKKKDKFEILCLPATIPEIHLDGVEERERRKFLKVAAGAGLGVFLLSLFGAKQAGAAFFGSVPGPGTIKIKDSTGTQIDPAIKSPTDGYGIMNVDNSSYPSYYGFVNKDGAWYVLCENPQNTFLYSKGNSDFSTNWGNRNSLTYASFDTTF